MSEGGIAFLTQSAYDLQGLETELGRTELAKDLAVSRPKKRTPEIILFGVDRNMSEEGIVHVVLRQNDALQGAPL